MLNMGAAIINTIFNPFPAVGKRKDFQRAYRR